MNAQTPNAVAEIYQSDLERHLFAPPPRLRRRRRRLDSLADRLHDWFMAGWTRWKAMAEAT